VSGTVILETLRRHFAHIGYVAALLLIVIIVATMASFDAPAGAPFEMIRLFIIVAGCQLIGPEFSSGTLQLVLSKPIYRSQYLLSRVAGVVLALWIVIALSFLADVIARSIAKHAIAWSTLSSSSVTFASLAVLVCSLMALFGSFTRSYLNVAVYLSGQIVLSMITGLLAFIQRTGRGVFAAFGAFLRAHPGFIDGMATFAQNIYPDTPSVPFDHNWLLLIFSNAAVALLLACLIFRKREVPYGAD
jgi:ABC-type transport system involved in multi-copper enzyme maturation permease subunit